MTKARAVQAIGRDGRMTDAGGHTRASKCWRPAPRVSQTLSLGVCWTGRGLDKRGDLDRATRTYEPLISQQWFMHMDEPASRPATEVVREVGCGSPRALGSRLDRLEWRTCALRISRELWLG